jgi:diphthamide biosynthesis protein 2
MYSTGIRETDCIIHFGRACLSAVSRIPVLYIFGRTSIDNTDCLDKFRELLPCTEENILLFFECTFAHAQPYIFEQLAKEYPNLVSATIDEALIEQHPLKADRVNTKNCADINGCCQSENKECFEINPVKNLSENHPRNETTTTSHENGSQTSHFGYVFSLKDDLSKYKCIFVGGEGPTLLNLIMKNNRNIFYTYNPTTKVSRRESLDVNKNLAKRYMYIEQAKDANIIGILVGTLGVSQYREIITQLKSIIKSAGKKSYTLLVGKLNIAKLTNFSEMDVFVLVACPENSLIDSHEFYVPIITPFELEIAFVQARDWTGDYITDFSQLLPGSAHHVENRSSDTEENDDEPYAFSFNTGLILKKPSQDQPHVFDRHDGRAVFLCQLIRHMRLVLRWFLVNQSSIKRKSIRLIVILLSI